MKDPSSAPISSSLSLSEFLHVLHHDRNLVWHLNGSHWIYFQPAEKKKTTTEENAEQDKDTTKQVCWDWEGVHVLPC